MLTSHQRVQLRRANLRVEDELPSTFIAIVDHPTAATARRFGQCGGDEACDGRPPIVLPFVAFRIRRHIRLTMSLIEASASDVGRDDEWFVAPLNTEPDADGVYYVPQLDARGAEALEFLRSFADG
jgi:hypothetical protein